MAVDGSPLSRVKLFMACQCRPPPVVSKSPGVPQYRIFVLTGSIARAKMSVFIKPLPIIDKFIPVSVLFKGPNQGPA